MGVGSSSDLLNSGALERRLVARKRMKTATQDEWKKQKEE
jgi:hypothetical protein